MSLTNGCRRPLYNTLEKVMTDIWDQHQTGRILDWSLAFYTSGGIMLSGCPSVRPSWCPSVRLSVRNYIFFEWKGKAGRGMIKVN